MKALKRLFTNINYLNLLLTVLGSAIVAFGTTIHVDSGAADGGVIGLCRVIEHYTNGMIGIELSSLLINGFCYLLAWRLTDMKFILSMGVGTLTYSLFINLFDNFLQLHIPYVFLATLVGMICIETGTGLMLRYGSSPNGEHALSMAIVKKGDFDFGWVSFIKDAVVILMFIPITNLTSVIYSLLLMTLTTPIMDYIVTAPKKTSMTQRIYKNKNRWIPILITGIVIVIIFSGVSIYLNDYYKADEKAINAYSLEYIKDTETVELEKGVTAYVPNGEIKAGFVFYPGGKVEYGSYEPLLKACAEKGIVCILIKMPQNLAIFGINKGVDVTEYFPQIKNWYIGGHSLGGSMAASCASSHNELFNGVVLLGAYSTNDITNLEVLSIYGSNDKVMNERKYHKYFDNLPDKFTERVINGGNHAYFGMYGEQDGDGKASISNIEQINLTAQYIIDFILE